jgi:thiamine-phosphate pyrophosphorylase
VPFPHSPLYAILDTGYPEALSHAGGPPAAARQLLESGVRLLQYRHKGPFTRRHFDECRGISELCRQAGAVFLVNDRADIALMCGAAGVHLGQDDLPPEHARRLMGPADLAAARGIIGFSSHSLEQALEGERLPVDYLAIGPVFPTTSKERPDPVVGLETVRAVRAAVSKPLVAIGGITLENARGVLDAGADAVVVIRDLLAAPDLAARARQFLALAAR